MKEDLVDKIARAVLYEGFILYPYRASSKKNRTRFTFGRVYPEEYSASQNGAEPCVMQTECLVRHPSAEAALGVTVRFLHATARDVHALQDGGFQTVPELRVDDKIYQTWQEAVEREVTIPMQPLAKFGPDSRWILFAFSETRTREPVHDSEGREAGEIVRCQERIEGDIELAIETLKPDLSLVRVRITNHSPAGERGWGTDAEVVLRTLASTHTILRVEDAEFISLLDPPPEFAEAAAACKNTGTWPVLAGEKNSRIAMLSSPIILYDYPEIAKESPGELCDGTEIDEILTLRILTMTDDEKSQMRQVDDFARRILERTESLDSGHLMNLHGTMRGGEAFDSESFFNPNQRLESVSARGGLLKAGDRVRIRPKSRADAMDMALAGKIGIIEAVEQDAEDKVHLALVIEDDPGRDLGMLRQPGHRFFYGIEEVEPLKEGE